MGNQTSYNNKATSKIVYLRQVANKTNTITAGDSNFSVVDNVNQLATIVNPKDGHIAIIWNPADNNAIPSIGYYLGGSWAIKTLKGDKGQQGERGEDGQTGQVGEKGEKGEDGRDGIDGFTPQHRWNGTRLQFQTPQGNWGTLVDLAGERGERGEKGSDGAIGKSPEHEWQDTQLRFKQSDGSWGTFTDLRGLKGEKGEQGAKGIDGINGTPPRHEVDTTNKRLRFELPEGGWGDWISYESEITFTGGLIKLDINVSYDEKNLTISQLINRHSSIRLEVGTNLFVRIFIAGGVPPDKTAKYDTEPVLVRHYWFKRSGVVELGVGGTETTDDDFVMVYANDANNENGNPLVKNISLAYGQPYYDGMGIYSIPNNSVANPSLQDYMYSTEKLLRRTLLESIKFKFSWGGQGQANTSNLKSNSIRFGISDIKGALHGSYPVTYAGLDRAVLLVRELKINIPFYEYIKHLNPVIIVDVYKKKKNKGASSKKANTHLFKSAGFKTRNITKELRKENETITNIPVTSEKMILGEDNFKVEHLFALKTLNSGQDIDPKFIFKTKGNPKSEPNVTTDGKNTSMCFTRLRFRLQWEERYSDGRIKKYRTADCGQLGVQIIRLTDADYENNFLNSQDESSKSRVHSGGETENIRCSRRLLTYKII